MSLPEPDLLSRRRLMALGAMLALPCGCAATVPGIRDVDLDALGPDQVLLLGRVRLTILDFDRTGDAFVRTNAGVDEVLLPPEGEIAWVVRRPRGRDIRLLQVSSSGKTLSLGNGPVLAPYAVRTAINYFGTVNIKLDHGVNDNRASNRVGQLKLDVVDEHAPAMAAFVQQNPKLAGRVYCHVLRGAILEAPRLSG